NFGLDGRVEAAVDGRGAGGHVVEGENEINDVLVAGRVVPGQPALLDEDAHRVGAGVARKGGVAVPGPDPQVLLRDADQPARRRLDEAGVVDRRVADEGGVGPR